MLARHLLFLATRRPHNTLLSIPSESIPPHALVQPPPYISPPKPEDRQNEEKSKEILKGTHVSRKAQSQKEKQQEYDRQRLYPQDIYAHDHSRIFYDNNQKFFERNRPMPNYNEYHRAGDRQGVYMQNAKNQQYYGPEKDINPQFYTLPTRRPQREAEPPRSVTPDITRGLVRPSLSAMHMLARHGQKPAIEQDSQSHRFGSQGDLNRKNLENFEVRNRLVHEQQQQRPVADVRNRFATPLNLTALGYRFFASSPVHDPVTKSPGTDALKHNPISPIGHGYGNGFKSSTPAGRIMPTVAERLALSTGNNCPSPVSNSSGRSTPVQTSSGRSTPTNLILSPTKSTMSNEELFAAIHKSKKRLNIREDNENLSPYGSMNSLVKNSTGSRNSWSPESQKPPEIPQNIPSPSATSRLDFKRLLLQQSVKTGPTRLSAAEQLKLSRQQCQQHQQLSSPIAPQMPLAKVLSPRSVWRFQTPRTDVLSSTIIEDTAAEEKAMKPSPESTSPISRLNAKRQLNLYSDLPDNIPVNFERKVAATPKSIVRTESPGRNDQTHETTVIGYSPADHHLTGSKERSTFDKNTVPDQRIPVLQSNNKTQPAPSATQYFTTAPQLTPEAQGAISAFESRRISNQLARAQFLASTPTSTNQAQSSYFKKRFRARSESPQHATTQNVARSPSAPTLETAL